jgi:hypothetical protein
MQVFIIPTLPLAALIALICMALAILGFYLFRRLNLHTKFGQNNAFTASIYPIIGAIYGVFLAFTVIIAWGQFLNAKKSATSEATYLSQLWRDAQVFPAPVRNQIEQHLAEYTKAVAELEWRTMAVSGKASPEAQITYEGLWQCYYRFEPQTFQQRAFYRLSLQALNELGRQRRLRILESRSKLPTPMWVFLICGGVLTIFYTYLFGARHQRLQGLVIGLLSGLIGFSLFLILSLQYPFTGDISIKPEAFQELSASFTYRANKQLPELRAPTRKMRQPQRSPEPRS